MQRGAVVVMLSSEEKESVRVDSESVSNLGEV